MEARSLKAGRVKRYPTSEDDCQGEMRALGMLTPLPLTGPRLRRLLGPASSSVHRSPRCLLSRCAVDSETWATWAALSLEAGTFHQAST